MKTVFDMPELLLVGIGNEIIYDKEQETRKINLVDGMQRTHSDWGKLDIKKKLVEENLTNRNNIAVPRVVINN